MTGFAATAAAVSTVEFRMDHAFAAPRVTMPGAKCLPRESNDLDRVSIQSRLESGLDRLLRDIEKFEEVERWDGLS